MSRASSNSVRKPVKQIAVCSNCGWGIYIGDAYYEVDEKILCEDCMIQLSSIKEGERLNE